MSTAGFEVLTVGHGTLSASDFVALLSAAGVRRLVDVRRFPGSRRHPHHAREALAASLPPAGVRYRWEPALGGRRRGAADSVNTALRNASFRAYADYMRGEDFWAALDRLLDAARAERTAVLCAESVWWRCHRRMIADALVLQRGAQVRHLLHDGRLEAHRLTDGVRRDGQFLRYDGGVPHLPL